jgi:ubiquinone biosynthesis protein UbiJ
VKDKAEQLHNLQELESAITEAISKAAGPDELARFHELLREVQDRLRDLEA